MSEQDLTPASAPDARRRRLLQASLAGLAGVGLTGCATPSPKAKPIARVVVLGGGFGGATAARYIRRWDPRIEVILVERNEQFISCPISNLVLTGSRELQDITRGYQGLRAHGVQIVHDEAVALDLERRQLRLARAEPLAYDRLILSPGIDFQLDRIQGLAAALDSGAVQHAWKAGPATLALRRQLQALPDGGVFAISIPKAPYRCPPGPYERASVVAQYLQRHKPRAKLLVLDANPEIVSKKGLFQKAWDELYQGVIEYRPNSELVGISADGRHATLELEDVRADLFNIIPPQRAGRIAQPLVNVNQQWVGVEFQGFESQVAPGVHVIGDAIAAASGMPKSGFMANNHAKVVADVVIARLSGQAPNPEPIIANTCYSFVSDREAIHVASVHKWNAQQRTLLPVAGAGGVSAARNELEASYAWSWAQTIWDDMLG